jgi:hypothetical protein
LLDCTVTLDLKLRASGPFSVALCCDLGRTFTLAKALFEYLLLAFLDTTSYKLCIRRVPSYTLSCFTLSFCIRSPAALLDDLCRIGHEAELIRPFKQRLADHSTSTTTGVPNGGF